MEEVKQIIVSGTTVYVLYKSYVQGKVYIPERLFRGFDVNGEMKYREINLPNVSNIIPQEKLA